VNLICEEKNEEHIKQTKKGGQKNTTNIQKWKMRTKNTTKFGFCKLVVYNVLTSVSRNRRKFTNNMHEQDKIAVTQFFQEVYLETVKRVSRRGKEWEPLLIYINS
jgi:hypothetical protein